MLKVLIQADAPYRNGVEDLSHYYIPSSTCGIDNRVPLGVLGALSFTWLRGLENDVYSKVGLIAVIGLSAKAEGCLSPCLPQRV